jgi:hypothetical protein
VRHFRYGMFNRRLSMATESGESGTASERDRTCKNHITSTTNLNYIKVTPSSSTKEEAILLIQEK